MRASKSDEEKSNWKRLFIAKPTKLLENKTRSLFWQQWAIDYFQLFILNKKQTKKIVDKKRKVLLFYFILLD